MVRLRRTLSERKHIFGQPGNGNFGNFGNSGNSGNPGDPCPGGFNSRLLILA